jgi:hypothetical protein
MQFCGAEGFARPESGRFAIACREIVVEFRPPADFALAFFSANDLLYRAIKRLLPPFRPRMTWHVNFVSPACNRLRASCVFC